MGLPPVHYYCTCKQTIIISTEESSVNNQENWQMTKVHQERAVQCSMLAHTCSLELHLRPLASSVTCTQITATSTQITATCTQIFATSLHLNTTLECTQQQLLLVPCTLPSLPPLEHTGASNNWEHLLHLFQVECHHQQATLVLKPTSTCQKSVTIGDIQYFTSCHHLSPLGRPMLLLTCHIRKLMIRIVAPTRSQRSFALCIQWHTKKQNNFMATNFFELV